MYYTWMDIEWKLKSDRINWPESWVSVEVYSSELIIYHTGAEKDFSSTSEYLGKIFGANWDKNNIINLQITDKQMQVIFEHNEDDAIRNPVPLPLFKQSFLGESYPLNSASISSILGSDDLYSSGKILLISYSLTPIGLLISFNAYSTIVLFFDLQINIPIVGLSPSVRNTPSPAFW